MAKPNRKETAQPKSRRRPVEAGQGAVNRSAVRDEPVVAGVARPFSVKSYLLMNGVFAGFCVLQLLFIRITLNESKGLYFFFGLLIIGFAIVSIYDYVYDRIARLDPEE